MPARNTPDKFWQKVDRSDPDGCWPWTACVNHRGYGRITYQRKIWIAHRLAWVLTHGDPGNLSVLHHCDNPLCCNPDHLFTGTHNDNMRDMVSKGRHPLAGAKLTRREVKEIIRLHSEGVKYKSLSQKYGVVKSTICMIVRGQIWRHLS